MLVTRKLSSYSKCCVRTIEVAQKVANRGLILTKDGKYATCKSKRKKLVISF